MNKPYITFKKALRQWMPTLRNTEREKYYRVYLCEVCKDERKGLKVLTGEKSGGFAIEEFNRRGSFFKSWIGPYRESLRKNRAKTAAAKRWKKKVDPVKRKRKGPQAP